MVGETLVPEDKWETFSKISEADLVTYQGNINLKEEDIIINVLPLNYGKLTSQSFPFFNPLLLLR